MAQPATTTAVANIVESATRNYVRNGPMLYISMLLHQQGCISTNKIWAIYSNDPKASKNLFASKSFMRSKVLHLMECQGKVIKAKADDLPMYKHAGWKLVPNRAFRNTAPWILAKMDPLPQLQREDYKKYLRENNIPFEF